MLCGKLASDVVSPGIAPSMCSKARVVSTWRDLDVSVVRLTVKWRRRPSRRAYARTLAWLREAI